MKLFLLHKSEGSLSASAVTGKIQTHTIKQRESRNWFFFYLKSYKKEIKSFPY